jgi:hypothetical protein
MSVLARFTPPSATLAQYDETMSKLTAAGFPPDGLDLHVCFVVDGNVRVSEIWDSLEQMQAFGPRLMPILDEVGIDPGQPEILEIHNMIRR